MNPLNIDQSPEELTDLYNRDFYWYLRSDQFREAFLRPIAAIINRYGEPCLDAGCGEGILADYVVGSYVGFDGSETAIKRAKARKPLIAFLVSRIEAPPLPACIGHFGTVVFGGIMEVLIKPDERMPLLEMYRQMYNVNRFIIYDLERLDTSAIEGMYGRPTEEIHATVLGVDVIPAKQSRKILVYSCR